jgi:hypothetical protein
MDALEQAKNTMADYKMVDASLEELTRLLLEAHALAAIAQAQAAERQAAAMEKWIAVLEAAQAESAETAASFRHLKNAIERDDSFGF